MESKDVKIFVGGLSYDTCETTLTQHFQKYGEVIKSEIMRNKDTGLSRGFGFVTFVNAASFCDAMDDKEHIIRERKVDVQKALPEGSVNTHQQLCDTEIDFKKIFVGGLPSNLSVEEFKGYFEKFGKIIDTVIICDKQNNPKGFGFITYESNESVKNVLNNRYHLLKDKKVEVKIATPKEIYWNENYHVYDAYNNGLGCYGGSEAINGFLSYDNYGDMYWCYQGANFYENYGHYYPVDYYHEIVSGAAPFVNRWNANLMGMNYDYGYNWYDRYVAGIAGVVVECPCFL